MLAQKFRYFGGDSFTDQQATKEKILSVVDENDQMVFYIDPAHAHGPLAGSSSFKHASGYAPGYIIRRVIDLATLHYTDYKLTFSLPTDANLDYYYVAAGGGKDQLITISADTSDTYYSGKVVNNAIVLSAQSTTTVPATVGSSSVDQLAVTLSPTLAQALPAFLPQDNSSSDINSGPTFNLNVLGTHGTEQYLVVSGNAGFSTPVVYDSSAKAVDPMTTQTFLAWGNYVALGVF
jgi:hypothetical protein